MSDYVDYISDEEGIPPPPNAEKYGLPGACRPWHKPLTSAEKAKLTGQQKRNRVRWLGQDLGKKQAGQVAKDLVKERKAARQQLSEGKKTEQEKEAAHAKLRERYREIHAPEQERQRERRNEADLEKKAKEAHGYIEKQAHEQLQLTMEDVKRRLQAKYEWDLQQAASRPRAIQPRVGGAAQASQASSAAGYQAREEPVLFSVDDEIRKVQDQMQIHNHHIATWQSLIENTGYTLAQTGTPDTRQPRDEALQDEGTMEGRLYNAYLRLGLITNYHENIARAYEIVTGEQSVAAGKRPALGTPEAPPADKRGRPGPGGYS